MQQDRSICQTIHLQASSKHQLTKSMK
uniref:Uncharacterized protein n=1 Tax=Rhizophora mucronata TaxID=61149 RepID=A0A2P2ML38_RHIMU